MDIHVYVHYLTTQLNDVQMEGNEEINTTKHNYSKMYFDTILNKNENATPELFVVYIQNDECQ